jgi:GTP-binding protein EngB required for normal cell division
MIAAFGIAAFAWLVLAVLERAISLLQRFAALAWPWQVLLGTLVCALLAGGASLAWWWLRPRRPRAALAPPDRQNLQARIEALPADRPGRAALHLELDELDRRRTEGAIYIALFGDISTGKSTLIGALVPGATPVIDARGGTTTAVAHFTDTQAAHGAWIWADVPGNREVGGERHEVLAREEILRAHAVVYVSAGELTRTQAEQVRWLADFGKPMLVALNKADQWHDDELHLLLNRLRQQTGDSVDAVVAVSAGGIERFERTLADGSIEQVQRQRSPAVQALRAEIRRLLAPGAAALEVARERTVLAGLHQRTANIEAQARAEEAARIVRRYAIRAIVGAMAAVAPGSDLLIQGVLAGGLTRALAALYRVPVSDLQVDDFIRQARLTLRSGTSVVLAVAGNALKAFPGLGTLGGGLLHAFAYALIFDSMGKALAASLAERHSFDQADAAARLKRWLADDNSHRLRELADLTRTALLTYAKEPDDAQGKQ